MLVALPTLASAQALSAPVIAVVDVQRATGGCNACKTALTQLEGQISSLKSLQASLEAPLRTEAAALQTAAAALNGKAPDAALQARATAFEKKQSDAQRQLAARDQAFQRNRSYVLEQIPGAMAFLGVAAPGSDPAGRAPLPSARRCACWT